MTATPYERGHTLGVFICIQRDEGNGSYDPRWDLADEVKRCTHEQFEEFRRGLDDAMKERS
jgi:hypothetical protein